ncbi:mobilization protein [Escherichia coli]|uniref:Mobilization protein n=1 Tax=Salmonella enterica subsp. enterica serovar Tennessee TaxID=143221 RepID=A0A5V6DMI0_SALET|nr:mobilization protein [Salmonella enterica subsp. enterica serovar Typhimurium]EBU7235205.1 mobilization protein [Salmonella enterica subsp. enterica serovar Tennessee]ECA5626899.1 mobilization protein [Salmonella enterica subsp. enterica serovar Braenderup]ECB0732208.1 mobilization protein [Salmonella enterica subsp. enterica serovar Enteritidis]ECT2041742.1 mobilization protein [Salmonella enterica subsp. enterica serovar Hadar]EDS9298058.1 mobilization protein [Salmonella enterica subsp. 
MSYLWSGSVSRKSRSGHWMALRWDGETMKNDVFSGLRRANVACSIWLHRYSCS